MMVDYCSCCSSYRHCFSWLAALDITTLLTSNAVGLEDLKPCKQPADLPMYLLWGSALVSS